MPEAVYNTSVYFNYTYEDEWLTSDFAKRGHQEKLISLMSKGPHAVKSPVLGGHLAGKKTFWRHEKTLLLNGKTTRKKVFKCFELAVTNCAPFILKLAKKRRT